MLKKTNLKNAELRKGINELIKNIQKTYGGSKNEIIYSALLLSLQVLMEKGKLSKH